MRTSVPTAGARAQYLMSDRPARRPASGRCCGGARGGASAPAPATAAPRRRGAALSPRAPLQAARRGATGGSRCYAVRTLYQQTISQGRPRVRDPRRASVAVDAARGQLAQRPRRREAAARSLDLVRQPLRFAGGGGRRVKPDSKQAFPSAPAPACQGRGARSAHLLFPTYPNSALFASLRPACRPGTARESCERLRSAAPLPRKNKAATWLILPVVICLSQRLSHACLSINCFIL